jgi:uncharacterized protein YcfJ
MKMHLTRSCGAAVLLVLASCAAGPNTQTGAVIGALGGAAAGGIIGHQSGRGLEGAAIGGGLGALGGAAIGNAQDQRNEQARRDYYERRGYYDNQGRYHYYDAPPPPRY